MTSTRSPGYKMPVLAPPVATGIAIARAVGESTTRRKSRSPGLTIAARRMGSPAMSLMRRAAPYTSPSASCSASARALLIALDERRIWPGSLRVIRCQVTSLARNRMPAGSVPVATRISLLAVAASAPSGCGKACRNTVTATPREIKNRIVRIVLAGIAAHSMEVQKSNAATPAAVMATLQRTLVRP